MTAMIIFCPSLLLFQRVGLLLIDPRRKIFHHVVVRWMPSKMFIQFDADLLKKIPNLSFVVTLWWNRVKCTFYRIHSNNLCPQFQLFSKRNVLHNVCPHVKSCSFVLFLYTTFTVEVEVVYNKMNWVLWFCENRYVLKLICI